jgi:hypothetical protein
MMSRLTDKLAHGLIMTYQSPVGHGKSRQLSELIEMEDAAALCDQRALSGSRQEDCSKE